MDILQYQHVMHFFFPIVIFCVTKQNITIFWEKFSFWLTEPCISMWSAKISLQSVKFTKFWLFLVCVAKKCSSRVCAESIVFVFVCVIFVLWCRTVFARIYSSATSVTRRRFSKTVAPRSRIFSRSLARFRYRFSPNGAAISLFRLRKSRRFMLVEVVVVVMVVQVPWRRIQLLMEGPRVPCRRIRFCTRWNMRARIWSWWGWPCRLEIWRVRTCWII